MIRTIDEAIAEIQVLWQRFENGNDRRSIFAYAYSLFLQQIANAAQGGRFRNWGWILDFEMQLAREYLATVAKFELHSASVPAAWRLAFEYAVHPESDAYVDLLLGINGLVICNLPRALAKVGIQTETGEVHRYDYDTIDTLIAASADAIRNQVLQRFDANFKNSFWRHDDFDDLTAGENLRVLREIAWRDAERLIWLNRVGMGRLVLWAIDRRAERQARKFVSTLARLRTESAHASLPTGD